MTDQEVDVCIGDLKIVLQYLISRIEIDSTHKEIDEPWIKKAKRLLDLLEGK